MPGKLPLLVLCTLLAATAAATAQPVGELEQARSLEVQVEPMGEPLQPLSGPVEWNVTVRVPCEAAGAPGQPHRVLLQVASKPPWMEANVTPEAVEPDVGACQADANATVPANATLTVRVTADAPAFSPAPLTVSATMEEGNRSGTGNTTVEAGFFLLLDVKTPESVITARPQADLTVPVTLTNLGNDRVTVTVHVREQDALRVTHPSPTNLPSRQQGDDDPTATVPVSIQTPYKNGYVSSKDTVELVFTAQHHNRSGLDTFNTTTSLLVTTKGWYVPGPGVLPVTLTVLAGAALLRHRRPS